MLKSPLTFFFFQLALDRKCRSFSFCIPEPLLFTCVPRSGGSSCDVKYKREEAVEAFPQRIPRHEIILKYFIKIDEFLKEPALCNYTEPRANK